MPLVGATVIVNVSNALPPLHLNVTSMTPYQEPYSRAAVNRGTVRRGGVPTPRRQFHVSSPTEFVSPSFNPYYFNV